MKRNAQDPIPVDHVRLSDACKKIAMAMFGNKWQLACAREFETHNSTLPENTRGLGRSERRSRSSAFQEAQKTREFLKEQADKRLADAIERSELVAHIRCPSSGQILNVSSKGWGPHFYGDHVAPEYANSTGPNDTEISGWRRPVFFKSSELDAWLGKIGEPPVQSPALNKAPIHRATEAQYAEHARGIQARHKRMPTRNEDIEWARKNRFTIDYTRGNLRRGYISNLPKKLREIASKPGRRAS
jgi:hypothetical protein